MAELNIGRHKKDIKYIVFTYGITSVKFFLQLAQSLMVEHVKSKILLVTPKDCRFWNISIFSRL
ncbi:hypothetical protein X975_18485, partial [Stegodyphus mimosarum]